MFKWMLPVVTAATIFGLVGVPVEAAPKRPANRYIHRDDRWHADYVRNDLVARAHRIEQRARTLYRNGRLSRNHRDRTLAKLERFYGGKYQVQRVSRRQYETDRRYLNQVERTLDEWSRSYRFGPHRR